MHRPVRRIVLAVALLLVAAAAVRAQSARPLVERVDSIVITVSDLDRLSAFYTDVLDFRLVERKDLSGTAIERLTGVEGARCASARLRLGDETIELLDFLTPEGRPIPPDSRSNDRWFQHFAIAVSNIDGAHQRLAAAGVRPASVSPQLLPAWNPNAGGISAFYFHDPDGHVLEIIHFPPGKGDPRWAALARTTQSPFLGIDHTAIVVADTDRSLAFYRDTLGLHVAGGSENYGVEQERLNNVFGAHLRITTLRAASGPGIEFLEYLSPATGRDYPRDSQVSDLWHWHVNLVTADPGAERLLRDARAPRVSAGPLAPDDRPARFIVRDPDGHAVAIAR